MIQPKELAIMPGISSDGPIRNHSKPNTSNANISGIQGENNLINSQKTMQNKGQKQKAEIEDQGEGQTGSESSTRGFESGMKKVDWQ